LIRELYDLDERKARQQVHKRDTDRARLLKDHFGVDIADPTEYDVTWNTDRTSLGEIADAVVGLVRSRSQVQSSHETNG
jgi:cytidylate kinase